jgi:hypothetical protein
MRQQLSIVHGAEVFWGEYLDQSDVNLQNNEPYLQTLDNPETLLIEKDKLWTLPKECKIIAEIILNLPEEMFLINGRVRKESLIKVVNEKLGWNRRKTIAVTGKLSKCLQS